jgi:hypothetical protein
MYVEGGFMVQFKLLSLYLFNMTEGNHKIPWSGQPVSGSGLDMNGKLAC